MLWAIHINMFNNLTDQSSGKLKVINVFSNGHFLFQICDETLLHILKQNENSIYGRRYKFAEMKTREDFVKGHPLTTFEHFANYVERIKRGERNILYPGKAAVFVVTSGTTKMQKLYPCCKNFLKDMELLVDIKDVLMLPWLNLQKAATYQVPLTTFLEKTNDGVLIGHMSRFVTKPSPQKVVPIEYEDLQTDEASHYTQALFTMAEREIGYISVFSADIMYSYIKFMTLNWDAICEDIANGEIGKHAKLPDTVKGQLSKRFRADPERASELRQIMKKGTVGLVKRAWPQIKFILMGKSAAFKIAASALEENQFKGVKIIDSCHPSSEGFTGLNLEGPQAHLDNIFTCILSREHFVEFIPLENIDEEDPPTLFPDQVCRFLYADTVKSR